MDRYNMVEGIDSEELKPENKCNYCKKEIRSGATVCDHCGTRQHAFWYWMTTAPIIIIIITIAQIYFVVKQYQKTTQAEQALQSVLDIKTDVISANNDIQAHRETLKNQANNLKNLDEKASQYRLRIGELEQYIIFLKKNITEIQDKMLVDIEALKKDSEKEVKTIIERTETKIINNKKQYSQDLNKLTRELKKLTQRNKTAFLADAIKLTGNRVKLDELLKKYYVLEDKKRSDETYSYSQKETESFLLLKLALFEINSFIAKSKKLDDIKVVKNFLNKNISMSDLSDSLLNKDVVIRGNSAFLLQNRYEKSVPDILIENIKREQNLYVIQISLNSFCQLTGFNNNNVVFYREAIEWWSDKKNKKAYQEYLKSLQKKNLENKSQKPKATVETKTTQPKWLDKTLNFFRDDK